MSRTAGRATAQERCELQGLTRERDVLALRHTRYACQEARTWGPQAVGTPCLTCPSPWGRAAPLPTPQPSPDPGSSGSLQISRPNPTERGQGAGAEGLCAVTPPPPHRQPGHSVSPRAWGEGGPAGHPRRNHRPRAADMEAVLGVPPGQGPTPRTASWASGHRGKG